MNTPAENKAVVRRWFEEVMNNKNLDAVDVICAQCAPSFVIIKGSSGDGQGGLDGVKALVQGFYVAFPDLHFNIDDQVAEDNRVVTLLTIEGTNTGEFMGMPPSNRKISSKAISVWLVGEGKLVEEWTMFDKLEWMQQLGVIAGPQSMEA